MQTNPTGTVTFLLMDVEGSTKLAHGSAPISTRSRWEHRRVRPLWAVDDGRISHLDLVRSGFRPEAT